MLERYLKSVINRAKSKGEISIGISITVVILSLSSVSTFTVYWSRVKRFITPLLCACANDKQSSGKDIFACSGFILPIGDFCQFSNRLNSKSTFSM
jgi:hypothetical protein